MRQRDSADEGHASDLQRLVVAIEYLQDVMLDDLRQHWELIAGFFAGYLFCLTLYLLGLG
jgi:hypothetical protein